MGSNYVDIRSSVADILGIANQMRLHGEQLTQSMGRAVDAINALDVPSTFPSDEFTDEFTKSYWEHVPSSDGGTPMQANEAVKQSATQLGEALTNVAGSVEQAMWSYQGSDDDSGTAIGNTIAS